MVPEFESNKFQCPHCQILATQSWFDADSAGSISMLIINDIYLNHRSDIDSFIQKYIVQFLNRADNNFQKRFYQFVPKGLSVATCSSCEKFTLWVNKEIVFPRKTVIPPPNKDLEESIKDLYMEAATILVDSPKGSTALLRLALQMLLKQVGKSGKKINDDIGELVSEGLSPKIQQALDLLRVIGNNAVHPG